jgi:hypothetical protein
MTGVNWKNDSNHPEKMRSIEPVNLPLYEQTIKMKQSIIVVSMLVVLFSSHTYAQKTAYKDYCNARFGYCISYPSDLKGQGEAQNGDGQTFVSKDGKATVYAFGRLQMDDMDDYKDDIKHEFKTSAAELKVAYQVLKDNWFILSGTDKDGNTVYEKTMLKKVAYMGDDKPSTFVFWTLYIKYPPAQQDKYKDYCAEIAKAFK